MKVGDAVRFIGFEGYSAGRTAMPSEIGLIVKVHEVHGKRRYDVMWPSGNFGNWLYAETLELINESG